MILIMKSVFETLKERGFIQQMTHEGEIKSLLENEKISFYIGFDPTADSLTAGHFMTLMTVAHMQRAGHKPIIVCGGGTGMVGDPTDKSEMRRVMSKEEITRNVNNFKVQFSKFIDFTEDKALMVNNADWLLDLKYVDFIREYGIHFSVNRMLTADAYRTRFERGLTFFEFNYMLMQAYDYLELFRRYNCKLQFGGNDQWSNIIAGVDLIRRVESADAYGMTFALLTTNDGTKMGKTQNGAVWLDPNKTSPYEFFQYWRNVHDADVKKFLSLLTFLPMEQVNELGSLTGSDINKAKEILAFEITKIVHGEQDADNALMASKSLFANEGGGGSIPTSEVTESELKSGINVIDLLEKMNLIPTRSEGRRLIQQGGIKLNDVKVNTIDLTITKEYFKDGILMIQKGKKVFHRVTVSCS